MVASAGLARILFKLGRRMNLLKSFFDDLSYFEKHENLRRMKKEE